MSKRIKLTQHSLITHRKKKYYLQNFNEQSKSLKDFFSILTYGICPSFSQSQNGHDSFYRSKVNNTCGALSAIAHKCQGRESFGQLFSHGTVAPSSSLQCQTQKVLVQSQHLQLPLEFVTQPWDINEAERKWENYSEKLIQQNSTKSVKLKLYMCMYVYMHQHFDVCLNKHKII